MLATRGNTGTSLNGHAGKAVSTDLDVAADSELGEPHVDYEAKENYILLEDTQMRLTAAQCTRDMAAVFEFDAEANIFDRAAEEQRIRAEAYPEVTSEEESELHYSSSDEGEDAAVPSNASDEGSQRDRSE